MFFKSIGVHKKPSLISTTLYDQVYFDRWDQIDPLMDLSDNSSQKLTCMCTPLKLDICHSRLKNTLCEKLNKLFA